MQPPVFELVATICHRHIAFRSFKSLSLQKEKGHPIGCPFLLVREAGLEAVLPSRFLLQSIDKDGCCHPHGRPLGDLCPQNCICKLCYFLRSSAPPSGFSSHNLLFLLSTKPAKDLLQLHNIMIDCYTNKLWNFVIIGRILLQHLSILGIILVN